MASEYSAFFGGLLVGAGWAGAALDPQVPTFFLCFLTLITTLWIVGIAFTNMASPK